jgi:hypothetical protein
VKSTAIVLSLAALMGACSQRTTSVENRTQGLDYAAPRPRRAFATECDRDWSRWIDYVE